jgi:hypothetical protein
MLLLLFPVFLSKARPRFVLLVLLVLKRNSCNKEKSCSLHDTTPKFGDREWPHCFKDDKKFLSVTDSKTTCKTYVNDE